MTKTMTLVAMAAALMMAGVARAQDIPDSCNDLDPSPLDTSNPAAFATILPCTGWDQTCQSNVMAAGASCIQEIQAIQKWMNESGTTDQIEGATGISAANATSDPDAIQNQTPAMAQSQLEARIPDLKTALGTCCGGQITPTCCA